MYAGLPFLCGEHGTETKTLFAFCQFCVQELALFLRLKLYSDSLKTAIYHILWWWSNKLKWYGTLSVKTWYRPIQKLVLWYKQKNILQGEMFDISIFLYLTPADDSVRTQSSTADQLTLTPLYQQTFKFKLTALLWPVLIRNVNSIFVDGLPAFVNRKVKVFLK